MDGLDIGFHRPGVDVASEAKRRQLGDEMGVLFNGALDRPSSADAVPVDLYYRKLSEDVRRTLLVGNLHGVAGDNRARNNRAYGRNHALRLYDVASESNRHNLIHDKPPGGYAVLQTPQGPIISYPDAPDAAAPRDARRALSFYGASSMILSDGGQHGRVYVEVGNKLVMINTGTDYLKAGDVVYAAPHPVAFVQDPNRVEPKTLHPTVRHLRPVQLVSIRNLYARDHPGQAPADFQALINRTGGWAPHEQLGDISKARTALDTMDINEDNFVETVARYAAFKVGRVVKAGMPGKTIHVIDC